MRTVNFIHKLAVVALASLAGAASNEAALAQQRPPATPPDFSSNSVGWSGFNPTGPFFEPAPGREPGPVTTDRAHPFVPNGTDKQPTFRIADLSNPNLKPWVKDQMKKDIDEVLAGKVAFTAQSACQPGGVPMFMGYGGGNPVLFLQTPNEVWLFFSGDSQVRRVYMDVPHTSDPKPSWYGESVGHYEGDELVVDTIGLNDKTTADIYRTPHTTKMHVVERWRMVDDGKGMEVVFTVDDPDTFYQPWTAMRRYRRIQYDNLPEGVCAENNNQAMFGYPIPTAETPDF
jgi:hypothetical protein